MADSQHTPRNFNPGDLLRTLPDALKLVSLRDAIEGRIPREVKHEWSKLCLLPCSDEELNDSDCGSLIVARDKVVKTTARAKEILGLDPLSDFADSPLHDVFDQATCNALERHMHDHRRQFRLSAVANTGNCSTVDILATRMTSVPDDQSYEILLAPCQSDNGSPRSQHRAALKSPQRLERYRYQDSTESARRSA